MASASDRALDRPAAGRGAWRRTTGYGLAALSATKAVDLCTTLVGLSLRTGFRESNPLIARVIASVGTVPGLVVTASLTVVVVALVTEGAAAVLERRSSGPSRGLPALRLVGYGSASAVNLAAAVHNAVLLAVV